MAGSRTQDDGWDFAGQKNAARGKEGFSILDVASRVVVPFEEEALPVRFLRGRWEGVGGAMVGYWRRLS